MKVLVVGSGGREDALVWKIGQSPLVSLRFTVHQETLAFLSDQKRSVYGR